MPREIQHWYLKQILDHIRVTEVALDDWFPLLVSLGIPVNRNFGYGNLERRGLDWGAMSVWFEIPFEMEGSAALITAGLRRSPLMEYSEILMESASAPIIGVQMEFFVKHWYQLADNLGNGQGAILATEDGAFFLEFTDDAEYVLASSFEIVPGTQVFLDPRQSDTVANTSPPELTHPYLKAMGDRIRATELDYPYGWEVFLRVPGIPLTPRLVGRVTTIDWPSPCRFELSLLDPSSAAIVTAGLAKSALTQHPEILMECGHLDPVVAFSSEHFIREWEDLVYRIGGQKTTLATPDGALFMEFTAGARPLLFSNFEIVPGTAVGDNC